jgi:hypothetical protein
MLAAVLFNTGGYDLFFQYMIYRSDNRILEQINNNHFQASHLVEIKMPVNLPAQAPQEYSGEYQPISGQVEVGNNRYDYAEIKITRDTIYLLVVPNPELNKLVKANVLYGKLVNDLPASNAKHTANPLTKKIISDRECLTLLDTKLPWEKIEKPSHYFKSPFILNPILKVSTQPPDA